MTYDNVPLFVGLPNSGISSIGDGSGYLLPCNSALVDHTVRNTPQRTLGKFVPRAKKFTVDNFIDCRVTLDFYLMVDNQMDNSYGFLFDEWNDGGLERGSATGQSFFPIMFGGNVYEECYLTEYTIDVKPFTPTKCTAVFKSFKPPQKTPISGYTGIINDFYNQNSSSNNMVFGHTCVLSGLDHQVVGSKTILDLSYNKKYGAKETNCIYDSKPKSYLVNSVDAELNIRATGFEQFLPYEGYEITGDIAVSLYDVNGSGIAQPSKPKGLEVRVPKGSFLGQENLGVRSLDTSLTRLQIKDVIL